MNLKQFEETWYAPLAAGRDLPPFKEVWDAARKVRRRRGLGRKLPAEELLWVVYDTLERGCLAKFDPQRGRFLTLFKDALAKRLTDYLRLRLRHARVEKRRRRELLKYAVFKNRTHWDESRALEARDTLDSLAAEDSRLLRMFFYERWTQRDMAQVLGWSKSEVCRRLALAQRRFKELHGRAA